MNFLDKIALNRLIKILTNFILSIIKILKPIDDGIKIPDTVVKPKRPLRDLLKNTVDKIKGK